ncbi:hypothetical protein [uncultured Sphingomonas sp.]|uniref:hypothetical protein n=1 Tax=uncultured Sphingomonas sp. TaxID=158754 RepID=UPI0035CB0715
MPIESVGLWIVRTVGGQFFKELFARNGLRTQLRSINKALVDSQDERERLAGVETLYANISAERDQLQAEVIRLRVENVALRQRLDGGK